MVFQPIDYEEYTEEELLKMKKSEATEGLNEKQQRFCEEYVKNYNVKTSMINAGYNMNGTSVSAGYKMRSMPKVQRYILWLKARILQRTLVKAGDIIDSWVRIAFADMTDFVDIRPFNISLKPSALIDGQLIKSVKSGRDGISIELHDKMRALDNLAKYTADMPVDWKQRLEERRMQLMEQEFELKKSVYDMENKQDEEDGFLEAIKNASSYIWDNTSNEEEK